MKKIDAIVAIVLLCALYLGAAFVMTWPPFIEGGCEQQGTCVAYCPPSTAEHKKDPDRQVVVLLSPSKNFININDVLDSASTQINTELNHSVTELTVVLADGSPKVVSRTYVDFDGAVLADAQTRVDDAVLVIKDTISCINSNHIVKGKADKISSTKGQDILHAMQLGANSFSSSVENSERKMFVLSDGIQTAGAIKMQSAFPQGSKGADQAVQQLKRQGSLGDFGGASIDWIGLAEVGEGNQKPLNEYSQKSLQSFWNSVITSANGVVHDLPIGTIPVSSSDEQATPDFTVKGLADPCVSLTATEDGGFAFQSDSTLFVNSTLAKKNAKEFASQIAQSGCKTAITVTGYVASNTSFKNYSINPKSGCNLSLGRANAFKVLLESVGVSKSISTVSGCKGPYNDWNADGSYNDEKGAANRIVTVTQ